MSQQFPEVPRQDTERPELLSLPGSLPPIQPTTPRRERSKRRLVVGLIIGGFLLLGVLGNATDHTSDKPTPPPGNLNSSGRTVTADQCHAEGGQIVGDSCYVP